jgi:hypothetical protein
MSGLTSRRLRISSRTPRPSAYFGAASTTARKKLGDTQFLIFLKSYQKSLRWKFGTTNDLAGLPSS